MKINRMITLVAACFFSLMTHQMAAQTETAPALSSDQESGKWVLVIHGGAGGPAKGALSTEKEKAYTEKLEEALKLGAEILSRGGSSLDAVEKVVNFMEDCPLFNAGKGSVLDETGRASMDAAIMDGRSGLAGAVGAVNRIKNPISAARVVMEKSPHVMLVGNGAEKFALKNGLKMMDPSYFITPERLEQWKKAQSKVGKTRGTVGAVALDQKGNLAAATSTGGMTNKMEGRIGDSPIIGAGTYANNETCAVSATGHGEFFIRNVVAYDLSALMAYRGMNLEQAGQYLIMEKLLKQKADGGLIAVDKVGNITMPFNTNAMFRGFAKSDGQRGVAIY